MAETPSSAAPAPRARVDTPAVLERALAAGISVAGVARAEPYVGTEQAIDERRSAGLFADLKFTMARPHVSCHPELLLDDDDAHGPARSLVSAALCYWAPDAPPAGPGPHGRIGRYTRGDAYAALVERLHVVADFLREHGHATRVLVDSNHHVDREAAARSGVGFYGKHTNVITRRHGSWVVLGTLATDAVLEPTPPSRPGCGSCTACIDACPTDAIVAEGVLDTRRCITYWTQSRHPVPDGIRELMGDMVYGCDICQDVCPWNRGVERRRSDGSVDAAAATVPLEEWLTAPDDDLDARYERFFVPRRQVKYLRRNALVALANAGSPADAALAAPFLDHPDAMLREQAAWTLRRLGGDIARAALQEHGLD